MSYKHQGAAPGGAHITRYAHITIPYHTIPYHTIPYHTKRYHTIPYHTIPYHTIPYHTIPYHTIPYHTIPYHTIPYHTIPYHTIPYHTVTLLGCNFYRTCKTLFNLHLTRNGLCLGKVQHGNVLVNGLSSLMIVYWESLGVEPIRVVATGLDTRGSLVEPSEVWPGHTVTSL